MIGAIISRKLQRFYNKFDSQQINQNHNSDSAIKNGQTAVIEF